MAINEARERVLKSIAKEITLDEAVDILRIAMEKEDDIDKFTVMRKGEGNKLFSLVVANCDADDEIHELLQEVIKTEFWDNMEDIDEDDDTFD